MKEELVEETVEQTRAPRGAQEQRKTVDTEDGPIAGPPVPIERIPMAYVHSRSLQRYLSICKELRRPGHGRSVSGVHPTAVRHAIRRLVSLGLLEKDRYIVRIRQKDEPSVNSGRGVGYVIYLPKDPEKRKRMIGQIDSPSRK